MRDQKGGGGILLASSTRQSTMEDLKPENCARRLLMSIAMCEQSREETRTRTSMEKVAEFCVKKVAAELPRVL